MCEQVEKVHEKMYQKIQLSPLKLSLSKTEKL